jgi:hypothetical protein
MTAAEDSGVDVIITIFCEKIGVFLKTDETIQIFAKTSFFTKTPIFSPFFLGGGILNYNMGP